MVNRTGVIVLPVDAVVLVVAVVEVVEVELLVPVPPAPPPPHAIRMAQMITRRMGTIRAMPSMMIDQLAISTN
jgi:hypothetical protein